MSPLRVAEPKTCAGGAEDARFMALALTLGRRGLGRTWPNPAVGAVVVKDGIIVGRGWTQPGGRPHAEAEAIRRAGAAARGATLYVTLEPCSHHGKTPPCADAIIAAGISRVRSRRPHITLKLAVSSDDKAALAGRRPAAITGQSARDRVHLMRAQNDAIMVGIGTVLCDDP